MWTEIPHLIEKNRGSGPVPGKIWAAVRETEAREIRDPEVEVVPTVLRRQPLSAPGPAWAGVLEQRSSFRRYWDAVRKTWVSESGRL